MGSQGADRPSAARPAPPAHPGQRGHLDEGLVAGTDRLAEAVELAAGDPYLARLTGRFLAAATRPARLRRMSGERDRYSLSTAALRIVPSRLRYLLTLLGLSPAATRLAFHAPIRSASRAAKGRLPRVGRMRFSIRLPVW